MKLFNMAATPMFSRHSSVMGLYYVEVEPIPVSLSCYWCGTEGNLGFVVRFLVELGKNKDLGVGYDHRSQILALPFMIQSMGSKSTPKADNFIFLSNHSKIIFKDHLHGYI